MPSFTLSRTIKKHRRNPTWLKTRGGARTAALELTLEDNSKQFARWFRDFTRKIKSEKKMGRVVLETAFKLLRKIIFLTPVDTGRARVSWLPFILHVSSKIKRVGMSPERVAKDPEVIKEGLAAGKYEIKLAGGKKVVTIYNYLSYIWRLEYGWSQQAPFGMVRLAQQMIMGQLYPEWEKTIRKWWGPSKPITSARATVFGIEFGSKKQRIRLGFPYHRGPLRLIFRA